MESIQCGLRQHWVEATGKGDDGADFVVEVSSGAGLSSPWLTVSVKIGGRTFDYRMNVSQVIDRALELAEAEASE